MKKILLLILFGFLSFNSYALMIQYTSTNNCPADIRHYVREGNLSYFFDMNGAPKFPTQNGTAMLMPDYVMSNEALEDYLAFMTFPAGLELHTAKKSYVINRVWLKSNKMNIFSDVALKAKEWKSGILILNPKKPDAGCQINSDYQPAN